MTKEELKKIIEEIKITYDYEGTYTELRNAVIDYGNDSQDWNLEYLFDDYVSYEIAEEIAKSELDKGGLLRLYCFLGDANLNSEIFRLNGYGNLENIDITDLEYLKDEILRYLND